jgi:hypothetical protein
MGVGDALVSSDSVALVSLWEVPTSPPMEIVAQMLKGAGKWMWRPDHVVRVEGCGGVTGDATAGD